MIDVGIFTQEQLQTILEEKQRVLRVAEVQKASMVAPTIEILALIDSIKSDIAAIEEKLGRSGTSEKPRVFISYSTQDAMDADKLKSALERQELKVVIDHQDVVPGEELEDFIRRAVRESDATLSIVSLKSLESPWVAMESIKAIERESGSRGSKRFISCFLDTDFLDLSFRLTATKRIDARIAEIDSLLPEYVAEGLDTRDIEKERSRLIDLRNHLGTILERFRNHLTLDIREPLFAASVEKIVGLLRGIE